MARFNIRKVGHATRFSKENPRPGPGRPKTKIIREYCRTIANERDPKTKRLIAEEVARALVKGALKGSLGHIQQLIQLTETDGLRNVGWPGESHGLTRDATAKLVAKLCR